MTDLLLLCTKLHTFVIGRFDWAALSTRSHARLQSLHLPFLRDLSLSGCNFESPATFLDLMRLFPALDALYVAAVTYNSSHIDTNADLAPIAVGRLKLMGHPSLDVEVIRRLAANFRVQSLDIPAYAAACSLFTSAMLESSGDFLRQLKLYPSKYDGSSQNASFATVS